MAKKKAPPPLDLPRPFEDTPEAALMVEMGEGGKCPKTKRPCVHTAAAHAPIADEFVCVVEGCGCTSPVT